MARRRRRRSYPPGPWTPAPPEPTGHVILAGNPEHSDDPMTDDEAERIVDGTCRRKHVYESWSHAHRDANRVTVETGEQVTAYRCPFSAMAGGEHWHVGHPPTVAHVERLALAIRWLAQHPDHDE